MEQLELIFRRRSIRRYTAAMPDKHTIKLLLKAGMAAPSANNIRPWHFYVLRNRERINALREFHPHASMTAQSPLVVVICGDLQRQPHPGYIVQDCSAATQNILLAATTLGLGGVWLGLYPREARMEGISKLLNLPEHMMPVSMVALGFPDENKPPHDEWYPAQVHEEGF